MNDSVVKEDKYENYLLVEGNDDKHVLSHLLGYHRIPQQFKIKNEHFEIKDHEGIDNLLSEKRLRTYLKIDQMRRFGIIVDADTNLYHYLPFRNFPYSPDIFATNFMQSLKIKFTSGYNLTQN